MTPKTRFIATLTVICVAVVTPLWGQQTMGPELPISELDNEQYLPHIAYNTVRDQYLVVWHNNWGGNRDIYGRRLDGEGNLLSWFTISAGTYDRVQPAVAYDEINDRYLVVYALDFYGNGTDWDLYGRLIPWNGPSAALTEFPIESNSRSQLVPEVAFAFTQQEFMVVWNNVGSTPMDVEARRVLLDGNFPIGSVFTVASGATDRTNPDIAYNLARNEYLVTYGLVGLDIMATRVTAGGAILGGGEFGIAAWPDPESQPSVAACRGGADQYFVVWQSTVGASNNDIYGRFVTGGGVPDGAPVLFSNTPIDEQSPDVTCHTGLSEYLVVWEQQYSSTTGPFGVFGQRLTTTRRLAPGFGVRGVITGETGVCSRPATAAGKAGGFLVAWEHDRQGTAFQDIHGRIVPAPFFADGFESGNLNAWTAAVP